MSDQPSIGPITAEKFKDEIVEFRRLLGTKEFWEDRTRYHRAVVGLGMVYVNLDHNPTETEMSWFQAALLEGEMRAQFMGAL